MIALRPNVQNCKGELVFRNTVIKYSCMLKVIERGLPGGNFPEHHCARFAEGLRRFSSVLSEGELSFKGWWQVVVPRGSEEVDVVVDVRWVEEVDVEGLLVEEAVIEVR